MAITANISARQRAAALLAGALIVVGAGGVPPVSAATAALAPTTAQSAEPVGTAEEAWVGGLTSGLSNCPVDLNTDPDDQFGETVVGNRSTGALTMRRTCRDFDVRVTSLVSDAEPAAGFPYVLRVTNIVTARRAGSSSLCGLSVTRHEVAWPNDVVPRAQYRDVELLTTFPDVILCGSADARVHLRVHAASEGGSDHRPPQVRVGNRRI